MELRDCSVGAQILPAKGKGFRCVELQISIAPRVRHKTRCYEHKHLHWLDQRHCCCLSTPSSTCAMSDGQILAAAAKVTRCTVCWARQLHACSLCLVDLQQHDKK